MLRNRVSISHTAFEVLWERAELGLMPAAVSISYPFRSLDNGSRLARQAFDELRRAGLASGDDVHPDLTDTLRLLARAERRYYALCLSEANPRGRGPLVALAGNRAVLAILDGDALRLRPVPADEAIPALIAHLPPNRPGTGAALNFRADELGADGRPSRPSAAEGSVLVETRQARGDADRYANLTSRPRTAMIYLYAVLGGHRCDRPIIALDVAGDGRWLTTRQRGPGGAEWITAAPATAATLVERLSNLR